MFGKFFQKRIHIIARQYGCRCNMDSFLLNKKGLEEMSRAAEAAAAAAGGEKAGRPTATTMEAEAAAGAAGAAKGGSPGGRKGPVIKRAPSRASGEPVVPCERRLLWRTAPTPTKIRSHRPSPNCAAGCGRITSCRGVHRGGGGRERASEMNNRVYRSGGAHQKVPLKVVFLT